MTTVPTAVNVARFSAVLETPAAEPALAVGHFAARLAFETDPSDVHADVQKGIAGLVVVDTRRPESYAKGHVPGAVNLPYRHITAESTARLDRNATYVCYCAGVGCNASTKGALRLAGLGFKVKEMLNGIEGWREEGYPVATGNEPGSLN
ncbi:MAG: rhodanese-like domain-containing protein [bacterium]